MLTSVKKTKTSTKHFSVGTRVCHCNNRELNEGVIIWVYSQSKGVIPQYDGKIYLVFWSNNKRGVYRHDELEKNNQKISFSLEKNYLEEKINEK